MWVSTCVPSGLVVLLVMSRGLPGKRTLHLPSSHLCSVQVSPATATAAASITTDKLTQPNSLGMIQLLKGNPDYLDRLRESGNHSFANQRQRLPDNIACRQSVLGQQSLRRAR